MWLTSGEQVIKTNGDFFPDVMYSLYILMRALSRISILVILRIGNVAQAAIFSKHVAFSLEPVSLKAIRNNKSASPLKCRYQA